VSRGGLKLEKALKVFDISPAGRICVDCGASTGGFTDVLLKNGAEKVYAIDVGYGQLAWKIRSDERVVVMERTNIRYVTKEQVPDEPSLAVLDVSFISLRLVLPVIKSLLSRDGEFVCLIKPQFEVGRSAIGKGGIVKDKKAREDALASVVEMARQTGFEFRGSILSPIMGGDGNIEYLAYFIKNGGRK